MVQGFESYLCNFSLSANRPPKLIKSQLFCATRSGSYLLSCLAASFLLLPSSCPQFRLLFAHLELDTVRTRLARPAKGCFSSEQVLQLPSWELLKRPVARERNVCGCMYGQFGFISALPPPKSNVMRSGQQD